MKTKMKNNELKLERFEFNGTPIEFEYKNDADSVMVNITTVCQKYGKLPAEFLRLTSTIRMIDGLTDMGITHNGIVEARKGGNGDGGGETYVRRELAYECARWCDIRLAIWMNQVIDQLLKRGHVEITNHPNMINHSINENAIVKSLMDFIRAQTEFTSAQTSAFKMFDSRLTALENDRKPREPVNEIQNAKPAAKKRSYVRKKYVDGGNPILTIEDFVTAQNNDADIDDREMITIRNFFERCRNAGLLRKQYPRNKPTGHSIRRKLFCDVDNRLHITGNGIRFFQKWW